MHHGVIAALDDQRRRLRPDHWWATNANTILVKNLRFEPSECQTRSTQLSSRETIRPKSAESAKSIAILPWVLPAMIVTRVSRRSVNAV